MGFRLDLKMQILEDRNNVPNSGMTNEQVKTLKRKITRLEFFNPQARAMIDMIKLTKNEQSYQFDKNTITMIKMTKMFIMIRLTKNKQSNQIEQKWSY